MTRLFLIALGVLLVLAGAGLFVRPNDTLFFVISESDLFIKFMLVVGMVVLGIVFIIAGLFSKIWGISILAGVVAGIIAEFLIMLFVFAGARLNLFFEGVGILLGCFFGPTLSLVVGIITIRAAKNHLTRNTSGPQ